MNDFKSPPGQETVIKLNLPVGTFLKDHASSENYWLQLYETPTGETIPIIIDLEKLTYARIIG